MNLHDSLERLTKLGLNIAEPVIHVPRTEDQQVRGPIEKVFSAVMQSFTRMQLTGVIRTESRHEKFMPLTPEELEAFFWEKKFTEEFILFKYPRKAELLMHGYCIPNPYFNLFQFSNVSGSFRVLWGQDVDERGFLANAPGYRKTIDRINSLLTNKVNGELENCEIEFAIFDKSAGVRGENTTFWGFRKL